MVYSAYTTPYNAPQYQPYAMPRFDQQASQNVPQQLNNTAPPMLSAQTGFRCIPVTSQGQADTFQIPFDGSTTYFVDTSNGKIYAKTFDFNTGAAPLVTYIRESAAPVVQYATIDDLNALREELTTKPKKVAKKDDPDD